MKKKEPLRLELPRKAALKRRGNCVQREMRTEKRIRASIGDNENLRWWHNLLRPEQSCLCSPGQGLMVCSTHRVTASFPSLKAIMALQEKGWEKVQEKCQGPAAQAVLHSSFLSLPGHVERDSFHRLPGKEASPYGMAAELSAEMQLGKKDLTGAPVVGSLIQSWPKYSRCTELAKGNI